MSGDTDNDTDLRVVKRHLRKSLTFDDDKKDVFISRVEELVCKTSRLMHHGSLLATNYVLYKMERGEPLSDQVLADQTFWKSCMAYCIRSRRRLSYPEIHEFARTRRHLIPETDTCPCLANCLNAAGSKLKSNVETMLSYRFNQRLKQTVKSLFYRRSVSDRKFIEACVLGTRCIEEGLDESYVGFVHSVRNKLFEGVDLFREAVTDIVRATSPGASSENKTRLVDAIVGGDAPPDVRGRGPLFERAHTCVATLLPHYTESFLPDEVVRDILREHSDQLGITGLVDQVVSAVVDPSVVPDCGIKAVVTVARCFFRYSGRVTRLYLKRHMSLTLQTLQLFREHLEIFKIEQQKKNTGRGVRQFPLLPIFDQKRQFVTLDADTLLYLLKKSGVVRKEALRHILTPEFRSTIFRSGRRCPFSENVSLETDGVAVIIRLQTKGLPHPLPRGPPMPREIQYTRIVATDPGVIQGSTTAEAILGNDGQWTFTDTSHRLTAKEYYSQAAIPQRVKYRHRRDEKIRAELQKHREIPLARACTVSGFENALLARMECSETVWAHKLGRWTSMLSMEAHMRKRSALDRYWKNKVKLNSTTVLAAGDGIFSATQGRKSRAVPREALHKAGQRFAGYATLVSEKYTTMVCSRCHKPTEKVHMRRVVKGVEKTCCVQGLRRCISNVCCATPFKSRDRDAAVSILQIFLALSERPTCYTRAGVEEARAHQDQWEHRSRGRD
jgi:hypothetical protein